jgi:oligopeptide/dipeptide ABC transporter ATP-binding protein
MYLGKIVELAERREMFRAPEHPYTQALFSAIPIPDPDLRRKRIILRGDVPSPVNPPSGCHFNPRCQLRAELGGPRICTTDEPPLLDAGGDHLVACHFRGAAASRSNAAATAAARSQASDESTLTALGPSPRVRRARRGQPPCR